jgi:solute carrier family 25 protein 39/40
LEVSNKEDRMSSSEKIKESLWVRISSGSVGSLLTAVIVTPLEVVKVRQQFRFSVSSIAGQVATVPPNVKPCPSCGVFVFNNGLKECVLPRSAVPYFDASTGILRENLPVSRSTGTISMLRSIWKTEGAAGIYAGLTPTLVMGVPNTVLYFTTYEEMKERLNGESAGFLPPAIVPAFAGASARLVASCATAPLELIKTRQAAQIGGGQAHPGLLSELQNVVRAEGMLSLYRGLSPTLLRDVPFSAVYWYFIEKFRACWGDPTQLSATEQGIQALINGTMAGIFSAAVTTPLDVVKTRRQVLTSTEVFEPAICDHRGAIVYKSKPTNPQAMGTIATMNTILTEEGIPGLWRGNQARMIKVAPACAIMLSSYEVGKRLLSDPP